MDRVGREESSISLALETTPMSIESTELSASSTLVDDKVFRINAKRLLLTYSQVPLKLTPQDLLSQLGTRLPIEKYLVGTEKHGHDGKHFHVLLITSEKQDIRNRNIFDVIQRVALLS